VPFSFAVVENFVLTRSSPAVWEQSSDERHIQQEERW